MQNKQDKNVLIKNKRSILYNAIITNVNKHINKEINKQKPNKPQHTQIKTQIKFYFIKKNAPFPRKYIQIIIHT